MFSCVFNDEIKAQCSYTPGGSCSTTISSPLTISGSSSWSGTVCVNEDVTIASGGILTISSGTNVSLDAGVSITVEDGGELIIDNAELYASGGTGMWQGIVGEAGNTIEIDHSTILHARIAVETTGEAGYPSSLVITNGTCLGNNEIGIYMYDDPDNLTHLIEDTEISAPALVAPKSGEVGDYGILIIGPSTLASDDFQIGNSYPFTSSTTFNHIHDVAIGIRTSTANTIVQNTFIENMLITDPADMPSGSPIDELSLFHNGNIGILATSSNSSNLDNRLTVGQTITGGSDINNYFYQDGDAGNNAIIAFNSMSTQIFSNRIEAENVSAPLMDTAIFVRGNISSHDMRNNIISNFTEFGILSDNITGGSTLIQNNTISRDVNPGSTDAPFGIYVDDATTSQDVEIYDNTIDKVETGIFIRNHDDAIVDGNIITYDYGAGNTRGIYAVNCSDILIEANSVTGPCYTGCPGGIIVAGIYVETCEGMFLKSNYSTNTKYGMVIDGNNQTGNMNCNEMYNCLIGYAMNDVDVGTGSNDLGPIEKYIMMDYLPADNAWYPSSTANREKSYGGTDLTNLIWRYRDLYFDGTTPLPAFDMPLALIDDPDLIPIDEYSDYLDTCSSPYRLSGDSEEALYDAFTYKFSHWINDALDGGSESSTYLYITYYWKLLQQYPQLIDSLVDTYQELYTSIENTNIPVYHTIQQMIKSRAYDSATILLEKVSPANTMEEVLSFVLPFICANSDSSSVAITDSEYEDLFVTNLLILK